MNYITFDTAAGVLLLSNIVSFGILMKRTSKSRLTDSSSILSISDFSSSVLTAILILLHNFSARTNSLNNVQLTYSSMRTIVKNRFNDGKNSTSTERAEACGLKSVFLQYAMFFIPFINAFISLLLLSINFYTNTKSVNRRCCELTHRQKEASTENGMQNECDEQAMASKDVQIEDSTKRQRTKKNFWKAMGPRKRFLGFSVLSQWIISALFAGIFQLGEYKNIVSSFRSEEDFICLIAANFPFENCIVGANSINETLIAGVEPLTSFSSNYNYLSSEDKLLWPYPNSSETVSVVSKVYDILQSVLKNSSVNHNNQMNHLTEISGDVNDIGLAANTSNRNYTFRENSLKSMLIQKFKRVSDYFFYDQKYSTVKSNFITGSMQMTKCVKNRCVVSTKFLKINLFLLFTFVYFMPIFISTVLLVITYYKCRDVAAKLKHEQFSSVVKNQNSEIVNVPLNVSNISFAEEFLKKGLKENESINAQCIDSIEQCNNSLRLKQLTYELLCQTNQLKNFYQIIKVNTIMAVVLWTPFFFQILSKVFLCTNVPGWLIETTFMATIIFAIFKNAVNLNLIKTEVDIKHSNKNNRIGPNPLE